MIGGGLAGVTRGGTAAIHGIMATAGIPITLIQAFTDIADSTTTDMAVTMDTGGTTESLRCILQIKRVATRSQGLRHMRRTRERHLRQLDKVAMLARASRPQVELIVP